MSESGIWGFVQIWDLGSDPPGGPGGSRGGPGGGGPNRCFSARGVRNSSSLATFAEFSKKKMSKKRGEFSEKTPKHRNVTLGNSPKTCQKRAQPEQKNRQKVHFPPKNTFIKSTPGESPARTSCEKSEKSGIWPI